MSFLTNKKTLFKMILSYIVVLAIPLVFGGTLYFTTLNIYRGDVDDANQQVLSNVRDSVNMNLSGISNMMQALFNQHNVITLSNKEDYVNFDYVAMSELQKMISMSRLSNSYIDEILIYFHKSDFLLTSKDYLNHVKKMTGYSTTLGLTIPEFVSQLNKQIDFRLRVLPSDGRGDRAFLIAGDGDSGSRSYLPNTTILVRLKTASLSKLMVSEHCRTFLVDEDGGSLTGETGASLLSSGDGWALEGQDGGWRCVQSSDPTFSLNYVRFIPGEIYSKNLSQLQFLAVAFFILCVLLGIPIAVFIARHSYDPIRRILALIPPPPGGRDSDDYKVISNSISDLLQRNKTHELERDDRSAAMRNYLFYRLLDGGVSEKVFLEECRKCEVGFENSSFLLVGFLIENGSNLFFEQDETANEETSRLLFIAITNILRETLGGDYRFFTAEYKGDCYALVNIGARLDKELAVEEIKDCCEQLTARLDIDFRAIISAAVSSIHSGCGEIYLCYNEVREIIREEGFAKRSAYVTQYRELAGRPSPVLSVPEHRAALESQTKREVGKHSSVQEICAYLDENYSNPDLTVGSVSDHFDMTTANLSLYFKRKTGSSPLEYIQRKRVQEAKRLIDTTEMRVSDIAKEVGYYDTRPLIRSFKRIEGITPVEYRDLSRSTPTGGC